jgi:hypothetical protein
LQRGIEPQEREIHEDKDDREVQEEDGEGREERSDAVLDDSVEIDISIPDAPGSDDARIVKGVDASVTLPFDSNVSSEYLINAYTLKELKTFAKHLGCANITNKKAEVASRIVSARC